MNKALTFTTIPISAYPPFNDAYVDNYLSEVIRVGMTQEVKF